MAAGLTPRRLGTADHDDIAALYRDLIGDQAMQLDQLETILAHPGTSLWGCEEKTRVVAMVTLHLLPNVTQGGRPYALIENVVTARNRHGQGAGRVAMQAAIGHAWAHDAYKIMLLTGQDTGARAFYEKLGFRADQKFGMQLRRVPPRQV